MVWAQRADQEEPRVHIRSILGTSSADSLFLRHMLRQGLESSPDRAFVANRDLLRPLCVAVCSADSLVIHDTLSDGAPFHLALYTRPFEPDSHQYSYFPGADSLIESIDGRPAYGAVDQRPTRQVDSLSVRIGKRHLIVPPAAYASFYEVNLCQLGYFQQPVMAYPSLSEKYLYLYLHGGEGASTYFAKLIFDRERYLTRMVAEYSLLRETGAIRPDFLGF